MTKKTWIRIVDDPRSGPLPSTWREEMCIHTVMPNANGTVTAIAVIILRDGEGNCFSCESKLNLKKGEPMPLG